MKKGFTFKNRHSSEFGVVVKTRSRRLLPGVKSYFYSTPLMDGSYDFTEANIMGREFYNDRTFELSLQITADCLDELEKKNAHAAIWLRGSGDLIFDSAASVKWRGRFISDLAFAPERRGKSAVISAVFQSEPIGMATFTTGKGIYLGDAVALDSDIPLDMSSYFEKQLTHGENTVDFINLGDFYVRPVLKFDNGSNITVTYGDSKIILEGLTSGAVIDLEKCNITDNSGNCILSKMQGNFFELPPGRSTLEIYADAPCALTIDYAPRTIYDFDFSAIDWGEAGA